jgi:hypothetical protein
MEAPIPVNIRHEYQLVPKKAKKIGALHKNGFIGSYITLL